VAAASAPRTAFTLRPQRTRTEPAPWAAPARSFSLALRAPADAGRRHPPRGAVRRSGGGTGRGTGRRLRGPRRRQPPPFLYSWLPLVGLPKSTAPAAPRPSSPRPAVQPRWGWAAAAVPGRPHRSARKVKRNDWSLAASQLRGPARFVFFLPCLTTSFRHRGPFSQAKRPSIVVAPLPCPALPQAKACSSRVPASAAAFPSPAASLCPMGWGLPVSVASSIYPTTWLKSSSKSPARGAFRELSPSSSFPACPPALLPLSDPFHPGSHLLFFTSRGPAPARQPFPPSSFSLGTFYAVVCQDTVRTAVCLCRLTPSFHPSDPKPRENVLILLHSFLFFFPLLRVPCFRPSCSPYSSCNSLRCRQ